MGRGAGSDWFCWDWASVLYLSVRSVSLVVDGSADVTEGDQSCFASSSIKSRLSLLF